MTNEESVLTVEKLLDVVASQLVIYGDKNLFIEGDYSDKVFQLFAGSNVDSLVLECVSRRDTCSDEYGLQILFNRLVEIDESDIIFCSEYMEVNKGFRIGFIGDGEFVETISSSEIFFPSSIELC